ncbi:MAG TPA: hypothetical protein VEW46_25230 [Pyrinomonadaceae bacterium]|nr:hypothetical protein [Pyrinomonadaceae bacterium]
MKALFLVIASVGGLIFADSSAIAQPTQSAQPGPAAAQAGDPNVTAKHAIGEIKTIDPAAKQLVIKTDAGNLVTVTLADSTVFMRLAPGETTLTKAAKIAFTDLGEGDRVWARGKVAEDRKSVPATSLIVMNKADIAKKQEAERAEWKRRGMLGLITAIKPETKEITVSTRTLAGTQAAVVIPVSEKVEMRRYAPDSIKFSDAKPATFEELKVGDQVRALGDRSPDGASFTAEKVVTGSFKSVAGVVTAIDAASGEVKINDLQTKQPLTILIKQDAVLRKFPAAGEGGMMMMGGGGGPARPAPPAGAQPAAQGPGGPGGPRPGGGMNINDLLERLPTIAVADVKVGDTIIVSSTKGADPSRLTAISLISGADTLLNMLAARQPQTSGPSAPNPSAGLGGVQFGIGLP